MYKLVILVTLLYMTSNCENTPCHLKGEKILEKYSKYIELSRSITVKLLRMNEKHEDEIDSFANFLIRNIQVPTTIIVENIQDQEMVRRAKNRSKVEKALSLDLHFIIAWDHEVFFQYLDFNPKLYAKASFIVVLLHPSSDVCNEFLEPFGLILGYLWNRYRILDSFGHAPCSCRPDATYIYRPFERVGNQWGLTKISEGALPIWNSMDDLQGLPFRISIFERFPTLVFTAQGMLGLDHNVLEALAKRMNFTLEIDDEKDIYFGNVNKDGSASGSLGKVVRGEVEMSGNSRFVDDPGTSKYQYTISISTDDLCIVVPKSQAMPRWIAIFGCFQWQVWLGILGIQLLCALFWGIRKKQVEDSADYPKAWLEIYSLALSVPIGIETKSRSMPFLFACLSLNVVIASIFQGNYVKSLSSVQYYKEINTLEEFLQSNYKISTRIINAFDGIESNTFEALRARIVDSTGVGIPSVYRAAHSRNIAALGRKEDVLMMLQTNFTDQLGNPMLHMVHECPRTLFVAYALQKDSPLIHAVNKILRRLVEGGFIERWVNEAVESYIVHHRSNERIYGDKDGDKSHGLESVLVALYFCICGNTLAAIVFSLELYWCRILVFLGIVELNMLP
ncbi:hypothetical protein JTB14_005471 [Gonioctena quinquepunctata]|nr:hypothetical protein JTB14_005471 [Gonioctena quinquepunctata]